MRTVFNHILIGIVCINSFSLNELYKVPMLAIHYSEHQQLDPSVSFIDFLGMHYWGNDLDDRDDARDNELPFKKIDRDAIIQIMTVPLPITLPLSPEPNFNTLFSDYQAPHFQNAPMGSLFKPPRLA